MVLAMRMANPSPIASIAMPIVPVRRNVRTAGAVSVFSAMPAAAVHPVSGERTKAVRSGTPSSDTVRSCPSGAVNMTANSVGDARAPIVVPGFGTRAKLMPFWSKMEIVQSSLSFCCSMIR